MAPVRMRQTVRKRPALSAPAMVGRIRDGKAHRNIGNGWPSTSSGAAPNMISSC